MLEFRLSALRRFDRKPMAPGSRSTCRTSTSTTSTTTSSPPRGRSATGRTSPTRSRTPTRSSGSPRRSVATSPGVTAQYESEVVFHRNREDLEALGRPVLRHGHRGARVPRARAQVVRHDHPAERQQVRRAQLRGVVRRLVHLRAAGRQGGHAAAGVLPDQHREHGPVRADARSSPTRAPRCTTSRGARRRCTRRTRCTRRSSSSSRSRGAGSPTRRSRTGRTTSTTS